MRIEPQNDDGAGNSGPGGPLGSEIEAGLAARHAADPRPAFAPAALVFEVMDVLSRIGVKVNPTPGQLHVASLAAADLLRALGVFPQTAPERRS